MFGALLQGAAVVTFDIATHTFAEFTSWLETEHISLLHPPALYFRRFLSTLEAGHIFPDVRIVALAGDVVLPADLQKWKEHFTRRCVVLHRFSITETALLTVSRFDHDGDLSGVVLEAGQPVADKTLTLIGPDGAAVTAGETGELVVQSDYLADGYWNRSEETAAAFSLDPCGTGQRIYRTGDLGRFLPDGTFVFLGRRGDQVKIRGYRVEVREIEAALMQLDDVREAVCIPWRDDGEQRLRAFIVWKDGREGSAAAIRARLTASLPEWKIPDDFQTISAIPTTLTGKADRQLLAGLATAPVHPSGEDNLQSTVLGIWCRVLRKPVAPDHAFFEDLGGTSLNALEIVTDIGRVTGRRLPLSLLLELNTPRRMSDYLAAQPDRERTVIALQSGGSLPPLFCVSGKGGSVIAFRPLAEALGADQPFYGITHHGIDPESRPTSLAALAACYADAIRQQQPEGPYYLAGYSAGGLIAFDIARQLARAGHRIAFIGLLDTAATQQRAPRLKRYRKYLPILRRQPVATLHRITRGLHRRALIAAQWMRTGTRPPAPEHEANRYYNSLNLQTSIQPYTGPVTLFLAREGTGSNSALPDAGWTKLCPQGLEIVPIDGEHLSILTSDVDGLAQALSGALTKAHPRAFRVSSDSTGQP
jgi:thioesterase domain-containing protein/acyl carrier protein